jgi:outer membrane protein assembly factor BamB
MRTLVIGIAITVVGACGSDEPVIETSTSRLEGQNRLTTNAMIQNGMFDNGMFDNGMFDNGLFDDASRSYQYALYRDDGVLRDGLWRDNVWQQNPAALDVLRTNPYTRDVLKYIYECAMTTDQSTTLDPATPLDPDAANVELHGRIGLAPEWGNEGGTCDLSCQRWVTACVLARTNAYGVPVDISMRVPDDAPEHIKEALAVTPEEVQNSPLREGSFYGNMFQTTPQADGPAVITPEFYACAGPGSNIPQVTKRFCSSQGAYGPITVVGTCEPRPEFPESACDYVSPVDGTDDPANTGALHHCFTSMDHGVGTEFEEVITVYIKEPISVCGDHVCDETEMRDESCPSDCHPDGWARTFPVAINYHGPRDDSGHVQWAYRTRISALGSDGTVVVMGESRATLNLGGEELPTGLGEDQLGVLAKYNAAGEHLWSRRFGPFSFFEPGGVTVARDGSIIASGTNSTSAWLAKFSTDGDLLWTIMSSGNGRGYFTVSPVVDDDGNVIVAGWSENEEIAFDTLPVPPTTGDRGESFVAKFSSTGIPLWAIRPAVAQFHTIAADLAIDLDGNLLLANVNAGLLKLDASGTVLWKRPGMYSAVTVHADGDVYATGSLAHEYDFPLPQSARPGDFFVVKYSANGEFQYVHTVPKSLPDHEVPCYDGPPNGIFEGRSIALDAERNVIVGIWGGNCARIDFGAGVFNTYGTADVFVAAFSPDLTNLRWVKHMPMILDGIHRGMAIDTLRRQMVMSGTYGGSMQFDDRLLVNNIPEQRDNANTFLATFAIPSPTDVTAPTVDHVPSPTVAEATGPDGAEVFFMPPTAIDTGNAGTTVACDPAPSTTFPIGTTQVTCTASDPLGNQTTATFPVTVRDTTGPLFSGVPAPITVEATGPAGAVVSFATPTAIDLVDGPRPVNCSHASGTMFPLGTTIVQCSSIDIAGHQTQTAFSVNVFTWSGILPPVNADGTSSFRLGRTIPVKFAFTGASSSITNAVATLSLVKLSPDPTGTVIEATSPGKHNTGNMFRYDANTGQYVYNLSTRPLTAGTWSLRIDLGNGVVRPVTISLYE